MYAGFVSLLRKLYENLQKEKMTLILTTFPYTEAFINHLSKIKFEYITKYTDYINIMTYDYISYNKSENFSASDIFNAPLPWISKTLDYYVDPNKPNKFDLYKKILLGIPFHGLMLEKTLDKKPKGSVMDSSSFSSIVNSNGIKKFEWHENEAEHIFEIDIYGKQMLGIYPTKKFIKERLNLSKDKKLAGNAIWEVAHGLESFMDEF